MKRYLFLILTLFIIFGCSINKNGGNENTMVVPEETDDILPPEPLYVDENPVTVAFYQNGKLVSDINAPFNNKTDITVVDVYFTNEENVGSSNTKRNFNKYAASYQDVSKYKIGFIVSFSVGDDSFSKIITSPKDTYSLSPYIYVYLYDDVHQPDGAWYSHVTEDDVNDETIYSSIKLYGAWDADKITTPISLTVFTYDTEDDFDDYGTYRGNSKYSITIKE